MKNPPEEKTPETKKTPEPDNRGLDPREPLFTPPATPEVKKQKGPDERDKEVVKDGEEFEVVPIEELPAEPHEHGRNDPESEGGDGPVEGKEDANGPVS